MRNLLRIARLRTKGSSHLKLTGKNGSITSLLSLRNIKDVGGRPRKREMGRPVGHRRQERRHQRRPSPRKQPETRRQQRPRRQPQLLQLCLLQSLRLGPSVLEPDLHLGLGQPQRTRELRPLGDAQVLLVPELLLEGQELLGGEGRSRFPVGFVLAEGAPDDRGPAGVAAHAG